MLTYKQLILLCLSLVHFIIQKGSPCFQRSFISRSEGESFTVFHSLSRSENAFSFLSKVVEDSETEGAVQRELNLQLFALTWHDTTCKSGHRHHMLQGMGE